MGYFHPKLQIYNQIQVKAHPVSGTGEKAKDPIFGLTMGSSSQASADLLR